MRNYELLIGRFCSATGDREIETVSTDEVLSFLTHHTEGTKQTTKRFRYSLLSSFFNFIRNSIDPNYQNRHMDPYILRANKASKIRSAEFSHKGDSQVR